MAGEPNRDSWTPQVPSQAVVPSVQYVQMLERELDVARRKIQEYETSIVHQANRICQSPLLGNPINYYQGVPQALIPPTYPPTTSSNLPLQHCFPSTLGPSHTSGFDGMPLASTVALAGTTPRPPGMLSTVPILYGSMTRDLRVTKRKRDWTDEDSESARKKARRSLAATFASESQPNSVTAIPSKLGTAPSRPVSTSKSASTSAHSKEPVWSVEYNPNVERRLLEVNLVRTLKDERGGFRLRFSCDGQLLALVADFSQVVSIYNIVTGRKSCVLYDHYVTETHLITHDLSFSRNCKYLATSSGKPGNLIRIWEVSKKRSRNVFRGHLDNVYAVDFSPDGRFLISGSYDSTLRIWNMRDGSSRIFDHANGGISCVRVSPDGKHVAAGKFDGEVLIWELRSGRVVATLEGHADIVDCVVFMPNGEGLVSSGGDGTLKCWDVSGLISAQTSDDEKGNGAEPCFTLVGHTDRIHSISVSPDSKWIASSSDDHTVRIWSSSTGAHQCILHAHEGNVYSVDFSPAGDYLASTDWGGTVRIWSYSTFC